jgi:dynein intermediate chain
MLTHFQERVIYNKEVQTTEVETESIRQQEDEKDVRQRTTRDAEAEAEQLAREKELEEESAKLDRELEQEIKGAQDLVVAHCILIIL